MTSPITFHLIQSCSDDWDALDDLRPSWEDRFGDDDLQSGGIVAWSSSQASSWQEVLAAYAANHCDHLVASDFAQVLKLEHQRQLLRHLYMFEPAGRPSRPRLRKVAEPQAAKAFSKGVLSVVGEGGVVFANTSPTDPFGDAPEYDLSSRRHCHFAYCACAVFLTSRYIGRVEVLFADVVET